MKIPKAIELLTDNLRFDRPGYPQDDNDAIKLGVEALKCVLKVRHHPFPDEVIQLPGETPEDDTT